MQIEFNNNLLKEKETLQNELSKKYESNISQITNKMNKEKEYLNNELSLSQKSKYQLINETSKEINSLRNIIKNNLSDIQYKFINDSNNNNEK